MLPFSSKQFLQVFGAFNLAMWPLQIVAYGVALLALVALLRSGQIANRVVAACLASMWLFTGSRITAFISPASTRLPTYSLQRSWLRRLY
jgi:hypothetical protein